jgi:hypothetical protein
MASQGRSDARGTAQLLASMALECLVNPALAREEEVALNNVYRLLESYRTNPLFGFEPVAQPTAASAAQRLTLRRPIERHVKEVRDALEHSRIAAFGDLNKDDALRIIEAVLRSVTYPGGERTQVTQEDQRLTTRFFQALLERLQTD